MAHLRLRSVTAGAQLVRPTSAHPRAVRCRAGAGSPTRDPPQALLRYHRSVARMELTRVQRKRIEDGSRVRSMRGGRARSCPWGLMGKGKVVTSALTPITPAELSGPTRRRRLVFHSQPPCFRFQARASAVSRALYGCVCSFPPSSAPRRRPWPSFAGFQWVASRLHPRGSGAEPGVGPARVDPCPALRCSTCRLAAVGLSSCGGPIRLRPCGVRTGARDGPCKGQTQPLPRSVVVARWQ